MVQRLVMEPMSRVCALRRSANSMPLANRTRTSFDFEFRASEKIDLTQDHAFDDRLVGADVAADLDPLAGRTADVDAIRTTIAAESERRHGQFPRPPRTTNTVMAIAAPKHMPAATRPTTSTDRNT